MDFDLDDDDLAIQDGMRSLCQGRFPIEAVRAVEESGSVIDLGRWREIAEMGLFSLGGDGLNRRQAVLAMEELGRALVPGPLVGTILAAQVDASFAGGDDVIAVLERTSPVTIIEHPQQITGLIECAAGGVYLHRRPQLELIDIERPLDALTPVAALRGELAVGEQVGDSAEAERLNIDGMLLTAAQQIGVAAAATDLATTYAKGREQFGRAIGSFQAIKHLLAEMLVKVEVARVAVHAAACAVDGASADDPLTAVRIAKLLANSAATFCGRQGIQIHGGMGFTWEVDAQRYWKRAKVLETCFERSDDLAEAVAETLSAV